MKVFEPFRLDPVNHCLWRAEERVLLTPKAFDVLRYLVEHPGRLVTQDEILEALWPETYVNPELIKKYILGIRKVLGDRSDEPLFIETFPKRGYQFVASVSDESTAGSADLFSDSKKMVGRIYRWESACGSPQQMQGSHSLFSTLPSELMALVQRDLSRACHECFEVLRTSDHQHPCTPDAPPGNARTES